MTIELRYSIEIDCAPGATRPGDLLPGVLKDTGVQLGEPEYRFFGNWTWFIPADQLPAYLKSRLIIETRLRALYESGAVRYASW